MARVTGAWRDLAGWWRVVEPEPGCEAGSWVFAASTEFDSPESQSGSTAFLFRDNFRAYLWYPEDGGTSPSRKAASESRDPRRYGSRFPAVADFRRSEASDVVETTLMCHA